MFINDIQMIELKDYQKQAVENLQRKIENSLQVL